MDFKIRCFNLVKKIPRGRVSTYKEVALALGSSNFRLVGSILSENFDECVPCHRVILSSGKLGGFNRGLVEKRELLESEGILIVNDRVVDFKRVLFVF